MALPDAVAARGRAIRERVAFGALLVVTAALYLWNLSASGWANAFYSAAAQAGAENWTAMLFGSSDASNAITVDKTPAALWVMDLSVRLFGLNSWSVLAPQALEGVAAVALLYAAVRRASGPAAALLAGTVFALTPVAALMFRFNNPDALLVLMLVAGAYCVQRACEKDSSRWWLVGAGVAVGFGFLAKMLQALLVLPAFGLAYLTSAAAPLRTRLMRLGGALGAFVLSAGWYLLLVELWPSESRPYIGGSQHDSIVELALGYNGLGRLTGDETGGLGNMNFDVGWDRLLGSGMGTYIAWLLPAAVVCLVAGLLITRRAPRADPTRAALILWGGWLVVTAVVFSYAKGIVHPYYTVALAPALAACLGIGAVLLWRNRGDVRAAATMSATVLVTAALAAVLLSRYGDWLPWLRAVVAVVGVGAAVLLVVVGRLPRHMATFTAGLTVAAVLTAPAAFTLATAQSVHSGAMPGVGPATRTRQLRRIRRRPARLTGGRPRTDEAAGRRFGRLSMDRRRRRLEQCGRLPTGGGCPGHGRRRLQRHRPGAHPHRVQVGRRRPNGSTTSSAGGQPWAWATSSGTAAAATTPLTSPNGCSPTSRRSGSTGSWSTT